MALFTCKDVSFAYEGNTVAHGLNFTVNSGDYLCIVGENGSGKSTLLKGLLRLKTPEKGHILFGDGLSPQEIGYLPQHMDVQKDFPASVYEVVLSGRLNTRGMLPFYTARDRAHVAENLKKLGIEGLSAKCYRELSTGQQQRVLFARALCATGKLLLLDEPFAGLDPVVSQGLYQLIAEINHDMGITVVMVSHDVKSAVQYASHVLHLKNAQLFFGKTQDYVRLELGQSFLGGEVS